MDDCTVPWVLSNPTIGAREFAILKYAGMGRGAEAVAAWLAKPKGLPGTQPDFGPVQIRWYFGRFAPGASNNTNNLSLAIIAQFGLFKILFAGDLEEAGWRNLLSLPTFRADLLGISVFVASHHGRESGCCAELFDLLQPQLVIISDDERQYESQDTDDWYRNRCTGAVFAKSPNTWRYVATTRKDGSMRIDVNAQSRWTIQSIGVRDWLRKTSQPANDYGFGLAGLGFGHNALGLGHAPATSLLGLLGTSDDPFTGRQSAVGVAPTPATSLLSLLGRSDDPPLRGFRLESILTSFPTKR